MDKTDWPTPHVVYQCTARTLGLFYIGAHTCTMRSNNCSPSTCNYKGSSSLVRAHKEEAPEVEWEMRVMAHAPTRDALKELECLYIKAYIDDPLCLNIKSTGQSLPQHTPAGLEKMRAAGRREGIRMKAPCGETQIVEREDITARCREGYTFLQHNIQLKNDRTKERILFSAVSSALLLPHIEKLGWVFGFDARYTQIGARELWEQSGLRPVTEVIRVTKLVPR
jgi:hypothetical protein